jgi:signal peptidase II
MTAADAKQNPTRDSSETSAPQLPAIGGATKYLIYWPLMIAGIIADLWSKGAVFKWLENEPYQEFVVIENFLTMVIRENAGAAFSIASGQRVMLVTVSVVALIVVTAIFFFSDITRKLMLVALGLFSAGICGNLYDRIFNEGYVRDFIDVVYWPGKHWPAFNVADSMLCIAVGLVFIMEILPHKSQQQEDEKEKQQQSKQG